MLPASPVSAAAIATLVDRIAASPGFVASEQLTRFLRHVVAEALAGRGARLREQAIGVAVFGRPVDYDPTVDSVVRVQARQLRFKLTEYFATHGKAEPVEITIPKGTYLPTFATRPVVGETGNARPHQPAPVRVRPGWWPVLAAVAVVALLVGWIARGRFGREPVRAVAVLPFLNLTGMADQDHVSDGLTEELTASLGAVPGLAVVARTSAFRFKGRAVDAREIGRELGVGTVLEGSLRRSGTGYRVTVQLIGTTDGLHRWAASYDSRSSDLISLQETVAREVTAALGREFGLALAGGRRRPTDDPVAYDLYLQARHFWNRRTPEAMARSIDLYRQAIGRDSSFALAHAGLGATYAAMSLNNMATPEAGPPAAIEAAETARRLDPSLGEAYATLGLMRGFAGWDWVAADSLFRRAISLSPNYATARSWYANTLTARGRADEALAQLEVARRIDPLSLPIAHGVGEALIYARRYDDALAQVDRILDFDSTFTFAHALAARAYFGLGQYQQAAEASRRAGDSLGVILIRARLGQLPRRRAIEAITRQGLAQLEDHPFVTAISYAILGEVDSSFAWLDRGRRRRHPDLMSLKVEPMLDPLRGDPRYSPLLEQVGLGERQVGRGGEQRGRDN
ncbi:MAG: tetratricopeptide repeat protein [Gemmatimonadales bacterium]|nr:tetratricopeptide repeat protein [Gemmatimonadales bacterium]